MIYYTIIYLRGNFLVPLNGSVGRNECSGPGESSGLRRGNLEMGDPHSQALGTSGICVVGVGCGCCSGGSLEFRK